MRATAVMMLAVGVMGAQHDASAGTISIGGSGGPIGMPSPGPIQTPNLPPLPILTPAIRLENLWAGDVFQAAHPRTPQPNTAPQSEEPLIEYQSWR